MTAAPRARSQIAVFAKRVRDFVRRQPHCVAPGTPVAEILAGMSAVDASSALVVDPQGRLIGILTERDIVRRVALRAGPETPVERIMTAPVKSIAADDLLFRAVGRMRRARLRHMPVIDAAGRPVGVLDLNEALAAAAARMVGQIDRLTQDASIDGLAEIKRAQAELAQDLLDDNIPAPEIQALVTDINLDIERRYNINPRTSVVQEAIVNLAKENAFHPVKDYLERLEWDGVPRVGDLFSKGFGASGDATFLGDAALKFCLGAVARIFEPGCKMDNMVVVAGPQGIGKSTAFAILANGWFADSPLSLGDKDAFMQMAGKWFYELSELDSFKKADNTRIKAFLTSKTDTFRPPYGKHTVERPRQTILVGTTNEDQFLNDPTGSRRFVPVRATKVDIAWLTSARDQLWAEAVVRYRAGEVWYYAGEDAARLAKESEPFQQEDVWTPTVFEYVARSKKPTVAVLDVLTGALGIEISRITRGEKLRVVHILKGMGCSWAKTDVHRGDVFDVPEAVLATAAKPTKAGTSATAAVPAWVTGKPATPEA